MEKIIFILVSEAQGSVTDHGSRWKDESKFDVIIALNNNYTISTTDFSNIVFWGWL